MSAAEKTYTFRASKDLGPRIRNAVATLVSLLDDPGRGGLDEAMRGFSLTLLRRAPEFEEDENQSALFRAMLEEFIEAVEKPARDRQALRAYKKWAAEEEEGRAVRAAAAKAAASRWEEWGDLFTLDREVFRRFTGRLSAPRLLQVEDALRQALDLWVK